MNSESQAGSWSLEVVRGRDVGHRFALKSGTLVLGNALNGSAGIDLRGQEGDTPRKMAARQSQLEVGDGSIAIRDLDSPGGTFVNRQRVLAGQARPLADGDVIQLGGVQLRLVKGAATAAGPAPSSVALAFSFGSGAVCRSWDDFLVISAQKWTELRDELTSGRLAAHLHAIGRGDLAPDPRASGSPDERLDAWIGRLPTTRPASPELDVHPRSLTIPLAPGGSTRRKVRISNTGFRLLRTSVMPDPAAPWLKVVDASSFVTLDASELTLEVSAPESFAKPLAASLSFDGNGGRATLAVRIEPAEKRDPALPPADSSVPRPQPEVREWIARRSLAARFAGCFALAAGLRLAVELLAKLPPLSGMAGDAESRPGLLGPAIGFSLLGAVAGSVLGLHKGEVRDAPSTGFAGGILGLLASAIAVAACRVVDSVAPGWLASSLPARVVVASAIGALVAALSILFIPPVPGKESSP